MLYYDGMVSFKRCKYTQEEFIQTIQESLSIAQVLRKLNLVVRGGNYTTIHQKIKELCLDTSHFTGQGWNIGKRFRPVKAAESLESILIDGRYFNTGHLKKRLLNEGVKEYKCEKCKLTEWFGQPISIELDHIDGRRNNNQLDNLQLLCPNCHAQTPTYRGKNKCGSAGTGKQHSLKKNGAKVLGSSSLPCRTIRQCLDCSKPIDRKKQILAWMF